MSEPSKAAPRKGQSRAALLGSHLGAVVAPALAARGLSESSLVAHWTEIVGEDIARFARFERLVWPPRGAKRDPEATPAAATLVLRIDGAFAVEAQHCSRAVAERVNGHLGWLCVGKVAFRQGPFPERKTRRRIAPPVAAAVAEARAAVGVDDEGLREALVQLGARVIAKARGWVK